MDCPRLVHDLEECHWRVSRIAVGGLLNMAFLVTITSPAVSDGTAMYYDGLGYNFLGPWSSTDLRERG